MRLRHIPRLQAAGSETALLLSSQEHQAADTRGATKQEEKGRGLCGRLGLGVRGARGPRTSPSRQGLDRVGAQHRLPGREGGGASCLQSTSPRLQNL